MLVWFAGLVSEFRHLGDFHPGRLQQLPALASATNNVGSSHAITTRPMPVSSISRVQMRAGTWGCEQVSRME